MRITWFVSPVVHSLTTGFPWVPPWVPICVDPLGRKGTRRGRFVSDGITVLPTDDDVDCMACIAKGAA